MYLVKHTTVMNLRENPGDSCTSCSI